MLRSSKLADNRLEVATEKGDYEYWLTQEDIADIARLEYLNFRQGNEENSLRAFDIIGSPEQLRNQLLSFKTRSEHINNARLTLIVNLAQQHWVTLVVTCLNKNYEGFYIDTFGGWLPENYGKSLENILIPIVNFSGYFPRQTDGFNCGLWALENADVLTRMADEHKGAHWIMQQLQRSREVGYFSERRRLLSIKLSADRFRQERLSQTSLIPVRETDDRLAPMAISDTTVHEPSPKKIKLVIDAEKVTEQLEFFVKNFVEDFVKRLGAHAVIAKGERLTAEALKNELKTGMTAALVGAAMFQAIGGAIPSVTTSLRSITSRYYTSKKKSQKITKAFSELENGQLGALLTEAAVEIFQSYEQQFIQITDKAGPKIALEKLAEDAAGRALNYIDEKLTTTTAISSEIIALGILSGKSETFFDPSLKKARVRVTGSRIQDVAGNSFSTASLFESVGLIIKGAHTNSDIFYKIPNVAQSTRFGYRRLLSWEKNSEGQLKEIYQSKYILENPVDITVYEYQLNPSTIQQDTAQLLEKISRSNNLVPLQEVAPRPKDILFNLRRPLKNFSGRSQPLIDLHKLLGSARKSAVVTQMAQLSLNPADRLGRPLQESAQAAVSGLGGIGKTQLALQYAKQHAADYDNNVLWIDSEKKIDIVESFKKLAVKLDIDKNDAYGKEKNIDQLIEYVYSYFSRVKSLFIFDNVENAKEIEDILPKLSSENKPTVLITSRYSNWKNIATPLQLGVFTEIEARIFIKTELAIVGNAEDVQITELANLLQSLPLALQQAVAYINSEKSVDSGFSIQNYIDRFKQTQSSQELLNFDISQYNNDPYSKTILTTWEITLEKIKKDKVIGEKAIEIIQIMAYLYPDNIINSIFFQLPNNVRLSSAIHLLKSYSLINEGSEPHISTIHRLVQKILRIKLESNRSEFEKIVRKIVYLTSDFTRNKEAMSHYFTFLLHMLEHKELTRVLDLKVTNRKILESLTYYEKDKNLVSDLFDFARITLPRENYLQFIGEALVLYMRYPFIVSLANVIEYVDQKINEGLISLEEAKFVLDFKYTITRENYKDVRMSSVPAQRVIQLNAIVLVFEFERKHFPFPKDYSRVCSQDRKKRSVNTLCALTEDERLIERPMEVQQIKEHIEKVRLVANLANLALLSKDTLSALIQGDFESVAINFALLSSSRVLGKISNNLLIKGGEQLAFGDEKLLLKKELDYDAKLAASLFTDKEIMLAAKRRFLGNAMKVASPFVARGTTLFFVYNFVKGLSSNQTDLLDNISNAAIVGLDVGEAGIEAIEYLGYIAGVSEFTGPIGEGLGFLIIAGIQLYHVEKELKAIEKWVHLSNRERFVEGIRAFFNFQPSEYLEAKANNDQLANKAIDFLKLHPEIQRYVFSAWLPATTLAKKKFVFLDQKRNITLLTDNNPEEPRDGHLFCLAGARSPCYSSAVPWIEKQLETFVESELEGLLGLEERTLYLCINAIGVEYTVNRTGNATLVALQGNATVIGAHSDSIFLINNGNQYYRAGDADDLFILQGTHITGRLQGGLGVNIVKFSDYQPKGGSVLLDPFGFLCGKNTTTNREKFFVRALQLSNFTQANDKFSIVGITVDTYAEKSAVKLDYIYITEKSSNNSSNRNITVKPNSVVYFLPSNTMDDNLLIYKVPVDQIGSTYIQPPFNDETVYQLEEFCMEGLRLSNITQIHGRREKQDKIFLTGKIAVVDTYAGENVMKPDYIYITEKSSKNLNIAVRPNTVVHLLPRNSTGNLIIYKIPDSQIGNAYVQLPFNDETIHQFYFESPIDDLEALNIKNNIISFQLSYPDGCFNLTIQNTDTLFAANNTTIAKLFFIQSASYIFNKNLEMKLVNEKTLYTQWHGNHSVDEIIQIIAPTAPRIDKAMVIQTPQNETIAMGGRRQEILSTDGLVVKHLVGNAGNVVYVIQIPKNMTDPFPLSDISLYNLENNALVSYPTTDTLDLREVLKKAHQQCNAQSILPTINESKEDLTLTLYTNYYFSVSTGCRLLAQSSYPLLKILLKNALNNFWYQELDIILDEHHPMNIIYDEDNWKLVSVPLVFAENKNIIVITDMDIKKDSEFFILKNIGQYDFIRNDTDLLLSNIFNNATQAELYTVLFSKFFQDSLFKEKVLSLSVNFLDASLTLNEYTQEINKATDLHLLIQSYFNASYVFLNQSGIFFNDSNEQSILRTRREISNSLPASSRASSVTPSIYKLFTYIPLKILQLASGILNSFNQNANYLNYLASKGFVANKKIKYSIRQSKEEKNQLVYCNKNNIFAEVNCVKNQSSLGLLGYCVNTQQVMIWFKKSTAESSATSRLSWFLLTYNSVPINTSNYYSNKPTISLSIQANQLYFYNTDGCQQKINLSKVSNTSIATLFPYLPEEGQQWLLEQWNHEKNKQDKLQQYEVVLELFKQNTVQIAWNYIGSAGLLHTFIGDYFQALGLRPNWCEHDPSYFLVRWLSAIQQLRLAGPNQTSVVAAALLETAILHPKIQAGYSLFLPNVNMRYKKQALRLCADLLQWGSLNFALMPSLLEMLFPNYLLTDTITWGLRAVLSFYMVNNDPSYYYLGIALFFLPQLPLLLEHMGIPVTAYVSKALEKLTQLFIFQSLLEQFKPTLDESRVTQRNIELRAAEQRVTKGSARVSTAVKRLVSFFKPLSLNKPYFNHQEDKYRATDSFSS